MAQRNQPRRGRVLSEVVAAAQAPVCQRKCCGSKQARQMLQPSSAHGHDSYQRASSHATVFYDGGLVPPLGGMVQMASVGIAGFVFISQDYFARGTSDLDTRRVKKRAM